MCYQLYGGDGEGHVVTQQLHGVWGKGNWELPVGDSLKT